MYDAINVTSQAKDVWLLNIIVSLHVLCQLVVLGYMQIRSLSYVRHVMVHCGVVIDNNINRFQ